MFVEEKTQGEPQPVKVGKMSEAIRKGLPIVVEEGRFSFRTCALGCAFAGVHGRSMTISEEDAFCGKDIAAAPVAERVGIALGFPADVAKKVNKMHLSHGLSALEIADMLEAEGF